MKLEIIIPVVIVLISALAYFFVIHSCNKQDNKSYNYFEFTCEDVGSASTTVTSAPSAPSAPSSNNTPRITSAPAPVVTNPPSTSPTSAPVAFATSSPVAVGGPGGAVAGPPVSGPGSGTGTGGGVGMGGGSSMDGPGCVSINQAACDTDGPWTIAGSSTGGGLPTYQNYVSLACAADSTFDSTACPVCNTCKGPNFNSTACEAALQTRCAGSPTLYPDIMTISSPA